MSSADILTGLPVNEKVTRPNAARNGLRHVGEPRTNTIWYGRAALENLAAKVNWFEYRDDDAYETAVKYPDGHVAVVSHSFRYENEAAWRSATARQNAEASGQGQAAG